jgi:hypothetical protein
MADKLHRRMGQDIPLGIGGAASQNDLLGKQRNREQKKKQHAEWRNSKRTGIEFHRLALSRPLSLQHSTQPLLCKPASTITEGESYEFTHLVEPVNQAQSIGKCRANAQRVIGNSLITATLRP